MSWVNEKLASDITWVNADITPVANAAKARAERGYKRGVVFVHIWKTGGTTMCLYAQLNGEIIQRSGRNEWGCSLKPRKPYEEIARDGNITYIEENFEFNNGQGTDFWSSHAKWIYMTMLRNPISRCISEWVHLRSGPAGFHPGKMTANEIAIETLKFVNTSGEMGSRQTAWLSTDGIGGQDLAKAKHVLQRMDKVLILEDLDTTGFQSLTEDLGWTASSMDASKFTHMNARDVSLEAFSSLTSAQKREFERITAVDMELYDMAKSLASRALTHH